MLTSKISSIKKYIIYYSVVVFVVVFLAATVHYFVYSHYLHKVHQHEQIQSLEHAAASVTRLLSFYQSVVDKISEQQSVADLLLFGDDREIQNWATDMQRLLPESIGLALFDNSGKVRGDKSELRLSDRCFTDLQRRFQGLFVAEPPVHYKIERLAHFDIVSPVVVDGENVGLVFASFSLDTIKSLLHSMNFQGETYQVITPENYQIAMPGEALDDEAEHFELVIPNSDWILRKQTTGSGNDAFVASLLISNVVTFILVSAVLFVAIKQLFNIVVSDFEILSWLMHKIKRGDLESEKMPQPRLVETEGVIRFIRHAAEELNGYQKKLKRDSTTDELTGLFNRRVLNEKIEELLVRANSGSNICMVILDMDHFKEINDTYGHDIGDKVLRLFSSALKNNCRDDDICTRAGGDEFIVVLVDYDMNTTRDWYTRVTSELTSSMIDFCLDERIEVKYGVSAGCSMIRNNDNKSALMKRADEALYQAKTRGRGNMVCS